MATITAELTAGTAVRMSNGRHTWSADEPLELQGTDTGPTPYELLLGSLAACTCITLGMYARHKGIVLRSVTTSYEFDRIHVDDCEEWADATSGFIDHITSNIEIAGDFDEKQRKRLAQVASRCPVHKTLEKGIVFSDNVQFA